jgi:three-Cys-motif partner protein
MGRTTKESGLENQSDMLWSAEELPERFSAPEKNFRSLQSPLWSEDKARLIAEYIKLFTYITKHGAYIDGFAAPQRRDLIDLCSAKLVLETEPKRVRDFWLCDMDPGGVAILEEIAALQRDKHRRVNVLPGDFNVSVESILSSGRIKESTATFALLDQRTFECEWSTVEKLSRHKTTRKIEIFYFFASGWIDRSIAAVSQQKTAEKVRRWWGRDDWRDLKGMQGILRAKLLADRFKQELGYKYAYPYAIHDRRRGDRTMYHMIHATDHEEASPLMLRAYRKVSGKPDRDMTELQSDFESIWLESQDEV